MWTGPQPLEVLGCIGLAYLSTVATEEAVVGTVASPLWDQGSSLLHGSMCVDLAYSAWKLHLRSAEDEFEMANYACGYAQRWVGTPS